MLALGVGNAWGALTEEYSYTFTSKQFSDNSTAKTLGTVTWTPATTWSSGTGYWRYDSTKGQQWGSSSHTLNKMILTSGTSFSNVKKIEINASIATSGGCKLSVKVGSTAIGTTQTLTKTATTYTFEDATGLTGAVEITLSNGSKKKAQYIKSIKIYTESSAPEKVLSSIEISGELTKDTYEEGEDLDLAGLTVTAKYDDNSEEDVTKDVEWSYTPNPLTKGTTSVSVTAKYGDKTATKAINGLTVNEHIIIPSEYCITPNNTFWGTNYTGTDAAAATTLSGKQNDITILHARNTSSSLYVNDTQTRAYAGHTMKISVPSGYVITGVAFTQGTSWEGTLSADCGTMVDNFNWKGTNQNVTITFNDGKCFITNICVTYIKDVKYALTITEPTEGGTLVVKDGENTLASGAEIYEGTKLTVTATPATGYEEGVVVVKNASDENVTADVYDAGTLTMPAYAVTISATFEKKPCTLLTTPVVTATPTYNSATLTWAAVANAAKYSVTVGETTTEVTEPTYTATGLNAETTYTYQVQAIAEAEQDTYCDSEVAEGSFTTTAAPVATLILSDIEGTTTQTGALNGTITLPTTAAECSKTFVGWDADENCDHAPTYAPGAEYTLAAETQTLYAVYADGEGGGDFTITKTMSEIVATNGYTVSAGNTAICYTSLTLDENITLSTTGQANCGSFWSDPCEWRLYQNKSGNAIVTATNGCTLTSVKFTFTVSNTGVLLNNGSQMKSNTAVAASGASVTYTVGNSGSATNGQVRITAIEVSYSKEGEYSNFSTSCVEALNAPTFSPAGGTFITEQNITLYAEEGDIYYTLDGSNPTKESNKYENIPVLLDECGTTTIKAIAISAESKSSIASATYTINLPITNTTATAYTPAEAIAIIDGECDKTEEVFVKGVVVSTSAFSAEYGNYDVIVKAVDDNSATPTTFTFYHMYKAASQTKFTASDEVIGVGDIITAKGKLTKYYSTYELADGCYMVERVAYTEPKTDISNTLETAYTVDKAFELISDIKSDLDKEVYVKGLVAVASTELYEEKYLTYSISDNGQNSGNVLKVYDGLNIDGVAFTSKDDVKVGDYVVVKGKLLNYKGTYEINKDNQLVQHKKAATITVSDITMEVGETKTIAATITPAAAETAVTYTIKENAANAISLSNNVITANAVGTATITATIATAADYMGKTVDFTVTVNAKSTKEKVVILAKYGDQWYAMMAQYVSGKTSHLAALPVTYVGGKLYNVADADKSLIEWERAIVDGKATFKNGSNYLTGKSGKTDLTLATTAYEWTIDGDSYLTGDRTFLYNAENNWFRHFGISNAGNKNYSGMPTVTAPVYATGDAYGRTVTVGDYGTICIPYGSSNYTGAEFYEISWMEMDGTTPKGIWLDQVNGALTAGKPYIFKATADEIAIVGDGTTAATPEEGVAGLTGTFTLIQDSETSGDASNKLEGNYMISGNQFLLCPAGCWLNANRAYIDATEIAKHTTKKAEIPGRRRVCLGETSENEATGFENIVAPEGQAVKAIVNGQLIIIRDGVKYNVQGQKL